jgi:hypothetical protein
LEVLVKLVDGLDTQVVPGGPCASEANADSFIAFESYGTVLNGDVPNVSEDIAVDCGKVANGSQTVLSFDVLGVYPLD